MDFWEKLRLRKCLSGSTPPWFCVKKNCFFFQNQLSFLGRVVLLIHFNLFLPSLMWVQNKHLGECNLAKRACNCAKTNKQKKQTITYISACNWSQTNKDIDVWESKTLMWNYLQRNKEPNKATLRSRSLDGNWTDIGKTDCAGFGMGMGCIGEERYTIYQFIDLQLNNIVLFFSLTFSKDDYFLNLLKFGR